MSVTFSLGKQRVRFAGKTDVGKVRGHNEDAFYLPKKVPMGVIADGMGGHACGEVASALTVETIDEYYRRTEDEPVFNFPFRLPELENERNRMATSIKLANSRIFEQSQADRAKKGMGCTVDAIYFKKGRFYVGHVGDSRVYRIRDGQLYQITEDHSLLNDYRRMKTMSGEEEENFPHKNVVVRALGLAEHVAVDVLVDEYEEGDAFMLCSDGLSDMISDQRIAEIMREHESRPDNICSTLIDAANEAGGKDNITALVAQILPG